MARVNTYLNFKNKTEQAFNFYKFVFGGDFVDGIFRLKDVLEQNKYEATKLFNALSNGGKVTMPLQDMFWGAYYGSCIDKFGVNWMINFPIKSDDI